ncbi:MAG: hypothetical protein ACI9ES_000735 [Oceanospirillaceae bacterium]|jgi:hypothetical protein
MHRLSPVLFFTLMKSLALLVILLLAGCLDISTRSYNNGLFSSETFESCFDSGGTIQESYPRSCALNGRFYTENINVRDKFERISLVFEVGPQKTTCQEFHSGNLQCLIVNGESFYEEISGFVHQPGKTTTIEVERIQICDPNVINSCPQDIGIYQYRWLRNITNGEKPYK